jgi:tetratricopeptide (TPR) repeat protein
VIRLVRRHVWLLVQRGDQGGCVGDAGAPIDLWVVFGVHPRIQPGTDERVFLAHAYRAAGDLGRAIPLYEQALADRERVLGADHPDTLASRTNLAYVCQTVGDLGRAIPLYEETLAECERVLDQDHPVTKAVRANRPPGRIGPDFGARESILTTIR